MDASWTPSLIAVAVTFVIGVLLTQALELREGRWFRIAISLPFTCMVGQAISTPNDTIGGIGAILSLAAIAFLWKDVFAHYIADAVVQSMVGFSKAARGVQMDLQYVKSAQRFGEYERAIELLVEELEKEPYSYEGLLLLSGLNEELKNWAGASAPLGLLLEKGELTGEQREHIVQRKKKLEDTLLVEQLNAR